MNDNGTTFVNIPLKLNKIGFTHKKLSENKHA